MKDPIVIHDGVSARNQILHRALATDLADINDVYKLKY